MNTQKLLLLVVLALVVVLFFLFDLGGYLTLDNLKEQQAGLQAWHAANPWTSRLLFFAVYVAVTALSLPGATVMTLAVAAILGFVEGLILVSFASTLGATLAFLIARFLLRDAVQARFRDRLRPINAGVEKDGAFYLFGLRLVPLFPFFVINLVMGLTPIRTWTYAWVSQVGMLPGTMVYVNAGTRLGQVDSLAGVLSPGLILSFALLGLFPLLARKALAALKARRALAGHPRPRRFDTNLVVIGAGSGGLVAAYIAAAVRARVTLIEKQAMGGDCLNTGCVPSKALIRPARLLADMRRAGDLGLGPVEPRFEFRDVMERVRRVIAAVAPHDSVERYRGLGVDVIEGEARVTGPYTVEVGGRTITTPGIVLATRARPLVPDIEGIDTVPYLTSDNVWALRELPDRLLVLGGGPIGCELAQAFARFGSRVTLVEMAPQLMPREDGDVAALVARRFADEGIDVRVGHRARAFRVAEGGGRLVADHGGEAVDLPFDRVLVALGRQANVTGIGLEELGVRLTGRGTIETNAFLQTSFPTIYACGDVVGPYQFTHAAAHQAWYASVNALFGRFRRFKVDYSVIPFATFTDPEVARVGLNEREATAAGVPWESTVYGLDDLDRAIADGRAEGFVKVLTVPGRDRILGATIVGEHAGELVAEFVLAMRHGLGLNKLLGTIHVYPTWMEANKYAAGGWKRAHAPERVLGWLERYHAWARGGGR